MLLLHRICMNANVFIMPVRTSGIQRCLNARNVSILCARKFPGRHNAHSSDCVVIPTFLKQNYHLVKLMTRYLYSATNSHPFMDKTDSTSQTILGQQSCTELLNVLSRFDKDLLTSDHTWLVTNQLLHFHYRDLTKKFSWLQSNLHVAYIQLQLRNDVRNMALPILSHENYSIWHDLLETNYDKFTDGQLADCFLSSLCMGFSFDDPLMHKFLYSIHDRLPEFGILPMLTISSSMKALPGFDFLALRKMLKRFETIIDSISPMHASGEELAALATICTNNLKFLNVDLLQKFLEWFTRAVRRDEVLEDPDHISAFLRMGQKLSLNHRLHKHMALGIISDMVNVCYRMVDRLDNSHIADICHSLKLSRCYEPDLAKLIEDRADLLLTEQSRLCEVTNLLYALTRRTPLELVRRFEGALHSRLLRHGDVDIIILSNIADSLNDLSRVNHDLLKLFQSHVVAQAHNIVTYISRYNKIVKLLVRRRFLNRDHEVQFMQTLLKQFDHQHGIHLHSISSLAICLLPFSYNLLPEEFYKKLIVAIPKWKEVELYRLALGINSMRQPMTGSLRRQMSQILTVLHMSIAERLESVETIDYLYQLTLGLVIHNRNRDPILTDKLMAMYPKFTKNLNDVSVVKVAQMFQKVSFYLPEVYDDMVKFVVDNRDFVDETKVMWVLSACAKVGYQPQLREELLEISTEVCRKLRAEGDFRTCLQLLNYLSVILLYPEKELAQLFTLEDIEELEKFLEENPQHAKSVEQNMMELNRSVVLECPQLDVPWFHEQFCLDTIARNEEKPCSGGEEKLKQDVQRALCEVLGGQKFVRARCYSSYFYDIDFECALDSRRKPIPVIQLNGSKDKKQVQKVAVCILHENSYCYNSKQLCGQEQLRRRHLEIMGYTYVEVAYFDWYSMGMADWKSKLNYIRSKVAV